MPASWCPRVAWTQGDIVLLKSGNGVLILALLNLALAGKVLGLNDELLLVGVEGTGNLVKLSLSPRKN